MLHLISLVTLTLAFTAPIQKRQEATTPIPPECPFVINAWNQMKNPTPALADGSNCCNIKGVFCVLNVGVTKILWHNQGLSGEIPPELGNLVNLKELYSSISSFTV